MNHLYQQFASYVNRTRINGSFPLLCKPRLIFSRINGPSVEDILSDSDWSSYSDDSYNSEFKYLIYIYKYD